MRHLDVIVPQGKGTEVFRIAEKQGGVNLSILRSDTLSGSRDLVSINLPNDRLDQFIAEAERIPDLRITLAPQGVIPLYPPESKVAEDATNVRPLSPIEIYLSGLQSVGSWISFMGYTIAASVIVWIGLFTNTIYLLIAAMLIAPFAGPAINAAIGTARGDLDLLGRSIFRYLVSLLLAVAITAAMSLLLKQHIATNMMISVSELSVVYLLLPLAAGAAGALSQKQSERNSLVSGAAVGLLISVSLAPPAGVIGMSMVVGRWDLVQNGIFSLIATIFGINLGALLVFRAFGITPHGVRYKRGNSKVFYVMTVLTLLAIAGLLLWQFHSPPNLQRSTREERATNVIQEAVKQSGLGNLVEADVRFTRPDVPGKDALLSNVYVKKADNVSLASGEIKQRLTQLIDERLLHDDFNVEPLTDVTVLEAPIRPG
jgi:uncharacterized hydrophobic protein (TIGR00341 family)